MNQYILYGIIFLILLALELVYFRVADHFNIIDRPNERSSHSSIVLRGGGIIFLLGILVWAAAVLCGCFGEMREIYPWFLLAVLLAAVADSWLLLAALPADVFAAGRRSE